MTRVESAYYGVCALALGVILAWITCTPAPRTVVVEQRRPVTDERIAAIERDLDRLAHELDTLIKQLERDCLLPEAPVRSQLPVVRCPSCNSGNVGPAGGAFRGGFLEADGFMQCQDCWGVWEGTSEQR